MYNNIRAYKVAYIFRIREKYSKCPLLKFLVFLILVRKTFEDNNVLRFKAFEMRFISTIINIKIQKIKKSQHI